MALGIHPFTPCGSVSGTSIQQVEEIAGRLAFGLVLEGHVEVGGLSEHVHERPEREGSFSMPRSTFIFSSPLSSAPGLMVVGSSVPK